jgi:hypothetical protein
MGIRIGPGPATQLVPPERDDEPREVDRGREADAPPPADDGGGQAARVDISNQAREQAAAAPAAPAAPPPEPVQSAAPAAPAAPPEPVQAAPAEPPPPPPEEEEQGAGLDLTA